MEIKKFKVLRKPQSDPSIKIGSYVYECTKPDYGCASDDTRFTGVDHISVTLDKTGDYPFFTIPAQDLEEVSNV